MAEPICVLPPISHQDLGPSYRNFGLPYHLTQDHLMISSISCVLPEVPARYGV